MQIRRPYTRYGRGFVETQVLAVFETHIAAPAKRVAEVSGLKRTAATDCLNRLHRSGQVSKTGRVPKVTYFLTPPQRAAL